MIEHILAYIVGGLIVSNAIVIWFGTTLAVHIFKFLKIIKEEDDVYTWQEWSDCLLVKSPFFGELLSCPLCLSFWISAITATSIYFYIPGLSDNFIPTGWLTWPLFSFVTYRFCIERD